jgi:hypothetical protein
MVESELTSFCSPFCVGPGIALALKCSKYNQRSTLAHCCTCRAWFSSRAVRCLLSWFILAQLFSSSSTCTENITNLGNEKGREIFDKAYPILLQNLFQDKIPTRSFEMKYTTLYNAYSKTNSQE